MAFPHHSASNWLCNFSTRCQSDQQSPTTPTTQPLTGITRSRFSLIRFRSPLLTESLLFSLPAGTEMFHFPAFPQLRLCVQRSVTGHYASRVAPFGDPRIEACLAAPRGLSQPATSFIGSWRQGIHRMPFLPWPKRCSCPLWSSQAPEPLDSPYPQSDSGHRTGGDLPRRSYRHAHARLTAAPSADVGDPVRQAVPPGPSTLGSSAEG